MEAKNTRDTILEWGASLVGFGDSKAYLPDRFKELPTGISIAVRLSDKIVDELTRGPTEAYAYHYHAVNRFLDKISLQVVNWLQTQGYDAFPIPTSQTIDWEQHKGLLSHKLVATRAGLGWVGKNALLITPEYGPRVRLTSVLTNAQLAFDRPVIKSQCGDCTKCIDVCPVKAIKGGLWSPASSRSELLEVPRCAQVIEQNKTALGAPVCGICVSVCPIGQKGHPR